MSTLELASVQSAARPPVLKVHVNLAFQVFDATNPRDLRFWLPILGPTASLALQTLTLPAVYTDPGVVPQYDWDVAELAALLGVKTATLWSALERLDRFGCARFLATDVLIVSRWLQSPTPRQIDRLPQVLRAHLERCGR